MHAHDRQWSIFAWLERSSSNGTHAQTTSPGSGSLSFSGRTPESPRLDSQKHHHGSGGDLRPLHVSYFGSINLQFDLNIDWGTWAPMRCPENCPLPARLSYSPVPLMISVSPEYDDPRP